MPQEFELGKWINTKWGTQVKFAEKLGVTQGRVSRWLKGNDGISPEFQAAIRRLGYSGPWPATEAQEAAAGASVGYATIEEVAELRGAMKAHVEYLERALEKMGEAVRLLLLEREQSRQQERK